MKYHFVLNLNFVPYSVYKMIVSNKAHCQKKNALNFFSIYTVF